jgi:hypothetical protein
MTSPEKQGEKLGLAVVICLVFCGGSQAWSLITTGEFGLPDIDIAGAVDTAPSGNQEELRAALVDRYHEELDRKSEYTETSENGSSAIDNLTPGGWQGSGIEAWCATFVTSITSQVYMDLGYDSPIYGGESYSNRLESYILPRVMDTNPNDALSLVEWAKKEDRYYTREDIRNGTATIQAGDLIVFESGRNHTGAVIEVNGDSITTAEGNISNTLDTRTYDNYIKNSEIHGFVDVGLR